MSAKYLHTAARAPTVCVKAIRAPLLAASMRTGRTMDALAERVGLSPLAVADTKSRFEHQRVVEVWDSLADEVGDDTFGLFAAQLLAGAPVELAELALNHARDVAGLMASFDRWQRLFHEANDCCLEDDGTGKTVRYVYRVRGELAESAHFVDFILATWFVRLRRTTEPRVELASVWLRRAAPADRSAHARCFGAPVLFGAGKDALELPREVLTRPISGADPSLLTLLEAQVDEELARLGRGGDVVERARAMLAAELRCGQADVHTLARSLGTTPRTLQRRLSERGLTYHRLLDEVRREAALTSLERPEVTITELAFSLGFSELSSFSRAFRRWTGVAPAEFRRAGARG